MALSPDALKVVDDFGHAPGVTKVHVDQLKKLFADSPELARQLNEAVDQKLVSSFQPLTDPHMGIIRPCRPLHPGAIGKTGNSIRSSRPGERRSDVRAWARIAARCFQLKSRGRKTAVHG